MNPLRVKLDALISKTSLTVTEQQREQLVGVCAAARQMEQSL